MTNAPTAEHVTGRRAPAAAARPDRPAPSRREVVFDVRDVSVFYGSYEAVAATTSMTIGKNQITALIGPSGCGKRRSCAASTG